MNYTIGGKKNRPSLAYNPLKARCGYSILCELTLVAVLRWGRKNAVFGTCSMGYLSLS